MLRPGRAKALIGADSVPRLRRSIYLKLPGANLWSHLRCSIHPEPIPFLQTAAEEIRQPRAEIVPLRRRRFAVHTSLSYPGVTRPRTGRSAYATKEFFIADGGRLRAINYWSVRLRNAGHVFWENCESSYEETGSLIFSTRP